MRYIFFIFLFFIGCNNDNKNSNSKLENKNIHQKEKDKFILVDNLKFIEKNGTISYEINSTKILLFNDNSKLSQLQIEELTKNKIKFYKTNNDKLKDFFKITKYPTIIILEKNSSKKYEGFLPNAMLKYELKD